jgi:hypothetical protein
MRGAIPVLPQYVFMAWCLVKHRMIMITQKQALKQWCHFPYENKRALSYTKAHIQPRIMSENSVPVSREITGCERETHTLIHCIPYHTSLP